MPSCTMRSWSCFRWQLKRRRMKNSGILLKFVVTRQLKKLADELTRSRKLLAASTVPEGVRHFAQEHLQVADRHCDNALSALKYNNPAQAFNEIQPAFFCTHLVSSIISKAAQSATVEPSSPNEVEQNIAYLASCLTKFKAMIEYKNFSVSPLSRRFLDNAMDHYNRASKSYSEEDRDRSKRQCQAGLLSLRLAELLLREENDEGIAGIGGLASPSFSRSIKELDDFIRELAALSTVVSKNYSKAIESFEVAVNALTDNNIQSARAQVISGMERLKSVRDEFAVQLIDEPLKQREPVTKPEAGERYLALSPAGKAIAETLRMEDDVPRAPAMRDCLQHVLNLHKQAVQSISSGQYTDCRDKTSAALFQIDLLREEMKWLSTTKSTAPSARRLTRKSDRSNPIN
jgi:hypothetical protein